MTTEIETEVWTGCYEDSWDGFIVPEAFAHPAKYARGLISRIFLEMRAQDWLQERDTVVDPFGGIASGGIIAAGLGLRWIGCELEEKFWKLGNQNIEMHRTLWEQFGDPVPVLVNGDSRKLRENLRGVLASRQKVKFQFDDSSRVSIEDLKARGVETICVPAMDAVVCSPPFSDPGSQPPMIKGSGADNLRKNWRDDRPDSYGSTTGQLGSMKPGTVDSVVSSPPYASSLTGDNTAKETAAESQAKRVTPGGSLGQSCRHAGYGGPGNLGNLVGGDVDAVVSSPPFEKGTEGVMRADKFKDPEAFARAQMTKGNGCSFDAKMRAMKADNDRATYGDTAGNVGNESGETFWHAARDIVQECHAILKPGGVSAWVVKDFIRKKSRVPFCDDWAKLLEACGFTVVKRVRAMLVKEEVHPDLFGGEDHIDRTERKSFFRRLYEKKFPENRIDWEEVVFARK